MSKLKIRPDALVQARDGEPVVILRGRGGTAVDMPGALMRELLPLLDGSRDAAAVAEALAPKWSGQHAAAAIAVLRDFGALCGDGDDDAASQPQETGGARGRVRVAGSGRLADACADAIAARGVAVVRDGDAEGTGDELALVICALEDATLQELAALADGAGAPCCFVSALGGGEIALGPTVGAAPSPCLICSQLELRGVAPGGVRMLEPARALSLDDDPAVGESLLALVAARVSDQAVQATRAHPSFPMAARTLLFGKQVAAMKLLSRPDCPRCAAAAAAAADSGDEAPALGVAELEIARSACLAIAQTWPQSPHQPLVAADADSDGAAPLRRVGIVGGGTAGYLTALMLRRTHPEVEVTLIESSKIPVIGVGEATTPEMVKFLHAQRFLGRSVADFYKRVKPTWKLGIQFAWGAPPPYEFPFPFQRGRLLESQLYDGDLDSQSLGAMLMATNRAPVFAAAGGELSSLIHSVRWAYHLDNRRFVAYLSEEARRAGVKHIDAKVSDVVLDAAGERVEQLVLDDGERRVSFDLYIDCSGFRSLLLGKTLDTPFIDYGATLATDRAVIAEVPNGGMIRPYTLAETYDSGWCWRIPFHDEDHRGYVFASSHCSDEQAIEEMRAKNPDMSEPRVLGFRSGRRRDAFRGNVFALGNSYGFVEPLESTALHMIALTIEMLTTNLPTSTRDEAIQRTLNRKIGDQWDALRWFLGIHYRFNRRLDTPFWRAANAEADISGAEERVALYRERAPLSYRSSLFYKVLPPDFFTDDHSFDTLMMGQKVDARTVQPAEDRAGWRARTAPLRTLARHAVDQARALSWLHDERSDVLEDFQRRPDSWLHGWLPA